MDDQQTPNQNLRIDASTRQRGVELAGGEDGFLDALAHAGRYSHEARQRLQKKLDQGGGIASGAVAKLIMQARGGSNNALRRGKR